MQRVLLQKIFSFFSFDIWVCNGNFLGAPFSTKIALYRHIITLHSIRAIKRANFFGPVFPSESFMKKQAAQYFHMDPYCACCYYVLTLLT